MSIQDYISNDIDLKASDMAYTYIFLTYFQIRETLLFSEMILCLAFMVEFIPSSKLELLRNPI